MSQKINVDFVLPAFHPYLATFTEKNTNAYLIDETLVFFAIRKTENKIIIY